MAKSPQELGKEADQMIEELARQAASKEGAVNTPEAEAPGGQQAIVEETVQLAEPQIDAVSQPAATPPAASVPESEVALLRQAMEKANQEAEKANQRWQVLQGMIGKKDEELAQMRVILANLQESKASGAPSIPAPAKLITDKDVEEYGADMIDLIGRRATEIAEMRIEQAMAPVYTELTNMRKLIESVGGATDKLAADTFEDALTREVPTWRQINVDPAFIQWLNQEDEFSGRTKMELLQEAYAKGNLRVTAKFFNSFAATMAPTEVIPAAQPSVVSEATPAAPSAEEFVSPGTGKTRGTPASQVEKPKTWTRASISALYADKIAGRITPEEFAKQEADLFMAQQDGRIAA